MWNIYFFSVLYAESVREFVPSSIRFGIGKVKSESARTDNADNVIQWNDMRNVDDDGDGKKKRR